MSGFKWRRWNIVLHRDIGYFSVALVIIYGVSGLAVNHVADWNPNYVQTKEIVQIDPIISFDKDTIVTLAMLRLQLTEAPQNYFRPDPETAQLFYPGKTYSIDLPTGTVLIEENRPRRVLFEMNQLHLNAPKGIWTYIADLFALSLIFMGVSGLFILKGKNGLKGRGKWFVLIGTALPLLYWIWYQFLQ
ncbi:MAG: PepSY-associated TM helix domain-containing protein [Bacteriovoracaceae bacterium]